MLLVSADKVRRGNNKQAKRRIYGLKEEGRRLDSAAVELEARLEDCRLRLDRVLLVRVSYCSHLTAL